LDTEEEDMMKRSVQVLNTRKSGLLVKGIIGLLLLTMGSNVYADLIVSNLAGDDGLNFGPLDIFAQSFTTDAQSYRLDNVILKVATFEYIDGTTASGIEIEIWDNDLSAPGTAIGSFSIPSLPFESFADTTFLPSTEILLNPSTTYWITATHASATGGAFQFRGTEAVATGPGTMGPGMRRSDNGGVDWIVGSSQNMKLEVNGTVVPAPAAVIMGILGLSTAATRLRRRRDLK
jgi:hypothetical protein